VRETGGQTHLPAMGLWAWDFIFCAQFPVCKTGIATPHFKVYWDRGHEKYVMVVDT
jgi:hypothetical protein